MSSGIKKVKRRNPICFGYLDQLWVFLAGEYHFMASHVSEQRDLPPCMNQDTESLIWNTAWTWVQREYDRESFDDAARAELSAWLMARPEHRQAYDKATRLWRLSGLVPRVHGNPSDERPNGDLSAGLPKN